MPKDVRRIVSSYKQRGSRAPATGEEAGEVRRPSSSLTFRLGFDGADGAGGGWVLEHGQPGRRASSSRRYSPTDPTKWRPGDASERARVAATGEMLAPSHHPDACRGAHGLIMEHNPRVGRLAQAMD